MEMWVVENSYRIVGLRRSGGRHADNADQALSPASNAIGKAALTDIVNKG